MDGIEAKREQYQGVIELEFKKGNEKGDRCINDKWNKIKETITIGAKEVFGFKETKAPKKPWITNEMLNELEERKKWKIIPQSMEKRNTHD